MPAIPQVTVVRPRHVAWGALWMFLFVAGGVAQTYLRFSERDYEIRTRYAQEELASLSDEQASLEVKVVALRSSEEIRKRATEELGLIAPSPTEVHKLKIEESLWVLYQDSVSESGEVGLDPLAGGEPPWLRWIDQGFRVAESSAIDPSGR